MKEKPNVTDYENLMKLMAHGRRLRNQQIRAVLLKIMNLTRNLFAHQRIGKGDYNCKSKQIGGSMSISG